MLARREVVPGSARMTSLGLGRVVRACRVPSAERSVGANVSPDVEWSREERGEGWRAAGAAGRGTPEQGDAADAQPASLLSIRARARRLIAGVRLMPADFEG